MDLSTIHQGMTPQATARVARLSATGDDVWARTTHFASQQPLTTSLTDAARRTLHDAVAAHRAISDHLVVIGTGGASLGAQALCAITPAAARVHFMKNCDSDSIRRQFAVLPLERTSWLIISKSGETVETLAASLAVKAHYAAQNTPLAGRVSVITQPAASALRALAASEGWRVLDHPTTLGGRFSVFSAVGMFPLAFAGIDTDALMADVDAHFIARLRGQPAELFKAACWFAASLPEQPLHVMLAYGDRLAALTQWYKQLWAESLGKDLRGPTPITAIGAVDQHSQLQLYLGGPRDKLFTVLAPSDDTPALALATCDVPQLAYLSARSMQEVMEASASATIATLRAHSIPVRVICSPWDMVHVARFMLDVMLETLLTAAMIDADPFTQPTVEAGKIRARSALGDTSA